MPLLYGEGKRAFLRLQEQILKHDDDQSVFAWSMNVIKFSALLASSPALFAISERESILLDDQPRIIDLLKMTPWAADTC